MFGGGVIAMDRLTGAVLALVRRHQETYGLTDAAVCLALQRATYAEMHAANKPTATNHASYGTMPTVLAVKE